MNDVAAHLIPLPYPVRGVTVVDEYGEPTIYLNARHSAEQHRLTYEHELRHLRGDDVYSELTLEDVERIASGAEPVIELTLPHEPIALHDDLAADTPLQISMIARMRAWVLYKLSPWDKAWKGIHKAFMTEIILDRGYGLGYVNRKLKPNPPLISQFIRRLYKECFPARQE